MMEVINLITCKINGDDFRGNGVKVEHGAIAIIGEFQLVEVWEHVKPGEVSVNFPSFEYRFSIDYISIQL